MYFFEFEGLIQGAALGQTGAWDRLAGYLREATEAVVRGMLNPPTEASLTGIAKEVLQVAQGELQRLGRKVCAKADIPSALSQALGFPKKPLLIAFERWFLHLAVSHCDKQYKPWATDVALKQLHHCGAVPPGPIMEMATRECLVRLGFDQRAVIVLYNVGPVLSAHKVTFRDIAAILGGEESDQAAKRVEKLSRRGLNRIKQIWISYE